MKYYCNPVTTFSFCALRITYGILFAQMEKGEQDALTRTLFNLQAGKRKEHSRVNGQRNRVPRSANSRHLIASWRRIRRRRRGCKNVPQGPKFLLNPLANSIIMRIINDNCGCGPLI